MAPAAQRIIGTRKVPQWLFLGHFFNDLLLADQAAKGASASSIRASVPRRIMLLTAAMLCLMYSVALILSFGKNKTPWPTTLNRLRKGWRSSLPSSGRLGSRVGGLPARSWKRCGNRSKH